jgi:outer membrane protein assembly factor BamB
MHSKNSPASATPVVTADRLYVHFGHMGTAALDLSGKVLWRQTSVTYPPVHGNGGSPVLVGGLLVFNCDGAKDPFVAALDAGSGEVRWKTPRDTPAKSKFSFSTPLVIEVEGRAQLVSAASGFVGGYDPADGRELWRVRYGEGYSVVPRPVYSHGLLFVSSGFDSPVLYAIRPAGRRGT